LPTSSQADVLAELAAGAAAESPLWADQLRPDPEREDVFGPLAPEALRLGVETIYEGYLVHYGRSRLFAPADPETALLLGDYLYAQGLVHVAATGDLAAVAALAELISTCAALRADGRGGDGEAWLDALAALGANPGPEARRDAHAAHAARVG
jgi:hypothetical protein